MATEIIKQFMIQFGIDLDSNDERNFVGKINDLKDFVTNSFISNITETVKDAIAEQIQNLDSFYDAAKAINASADALQSFTMSSLAAGQSADGMASIIQHLNKAATESARGWGSGAEQFAIVGISARDAAGNIKDTVQLIADVKSKLDGKSRTQKATILEYLGLSEQDAVYFTDEIMSAYDDISSVMTAFPYDVNVAAKAANDFTANLNKLNSVFTIVKQNVTTDVLPALVDSSESLYKAIMHHASEIRYFVKIIADIVTRSVQAASRLLTKVIGWGSKIIKSLKTFNDEMGGVPLKIAAIITAVKVLGAAWKASGIGLAVTLLATAIAAIADDIETWKEGGQSLIDWGDALDKINKIAPSIDKQFANIRNKLLDSSEYLRTAEKYFRGLSLTDSVKKMLKDFQWLADNIKDIWDACTKYITDSIKDSLKDIPVIGNIFSDKMPNGITLTAQPIESALSTGQELTGAPQQNNITNNTTINVTSSATQPSAVASEIARRQQAIIDSAMQRYRRYK